MTKEEKELLLKELCSRSQHGVKVWRQGGNYVLSCIDIEKQRVYLKVGFEATRGWWFDIEEVKLYLRPMSSMTEEEQSTLDSMCNGVEMVSRLSGLKMFDKAFDWLNEHHFDYRGLIPMGLALEAPEDMYTQK